MDLKRAALGYNRGSLKMANRFLKEALKRKSEIDRSDVKPYVSKLLDKVGKLENEQDAIRIAEDALMYSTLLQNASLHSPSI